jgi:hypothetical protein
MKEQMTYIAIDADDVGQSIGGAVISDDADELSAISGKINNGVKIFSKWAEYNGGSVISSGSDEAIFKVPLSSIEELEDLKNKYQKLTGFSISIGIGEKISDAAKALIYAKVNGKNQIVDYSPEIEEVMRQSITGNLDQEKPEQKLEGGVGDETEPSDVDSKQLKEGRVVEKEHTDNEEEAEEIALDHLTEDPEYYSKLQEIESSKPKTRRPKFEKEEDEALVDQDSEESEEVEDEDLNLLEEDESEEESFVDQEDLDVDGRPDKQEEHGEITPEDDVDGDGDVEHEEAMAVEAGEEDKYSDEGDFSDEYLEEELADEELADEEQSQQDTESEEEEQMSEDGEKEPEDEMSDEDMEDEDNLDNSIASEMSDENEDELEEGDVTDEALKQAIFDSLQIFKENRDILSSLATQNPDLYNALVISLQSMIEMAKELGYGGYGDNLQQETEPEKLEAEDEESSDQDEDMNPDDYEVSEDMSDSDDVLKNESFYSLVSKINNAKNLLGMKKKEDKKQMLLKLKEKLKKIKNKSSDAKKKPLEDKKKKPPKPKKVEAASFCASSNQKMKTAGHDCRANEDKDSPMCTARKKMNCRGKNAEKGAAVQKSEKLKNFLENKRKKN